MPRRSLSFYWRSYLRTAVHFRNGIDVAWNHYRRTDTDAAVFWNGDRFRMPARRAGLADTVVEIWGSEVYTSGGFYQPRDGDVILDVGANVGAFSLWAIAQAPGARVIAVEPSSENFAVLERNMRAARHPVAMHQVAIGGRRGKGHMVDGGRRSIEHRLAAGSASGSSGGDVEVLTLEDLLQLAGASDVDFLKMDIEGSERDVFAGAAPELLRHFRRISLEYHDNLRPGTLAFLRDSLSPTHDIVSVDGSAEGYGILRARLRQALETSH